MASVTSRPGPPVPGRPLPLATDPVNVEPKASTDDRITKVLLSGGGSKISGFANAFKERTGIETSLMDPLAHMLPSRGFDPEYLEMMAPMLAVGIGLATRRADR